MKVRGKSILFKFITILALLVALLLVQSTLSARSAKHWGGTQQAPTLSKAEQIMQLNRAVQAGNVTAVSTTSQTCDDGMAGPYPCSNVDLLAFVPTNALVGGTSADIWGWTDPATGKEYAITSHNNSTSFVDISDPVNPIFLGYVPAPVPNILWRDVKVYDNHAYIVGDGDFVIPHGLQIFDLTQLRDVTTPPVIFEQTARFMGVDNSHNIAINEETGVAYLVGSSRCSAGLFMLDLTNDPTNPAELGCFSDDGYTHDVQCVVYDGPDAAHVGKEICVAANEDTLTFVDVTDKSNPVQLSREGYAGSAYTHQGWFTEDHAFFISNDELDEQNFGHNTHSYIWDVRDLENPVLINTYVGPTTSIDHNLYIRDGFVFESNYTSGLRILDTADIANGNLTEVAFFDTHPASDVAQFAGTWSNYPYFESGVVILSNIEDGLYIVQPNLPGQEEPPTLPEGGGFVTGAGWLQTNENGRLNFFVRARDVGKHFESELRIRDRDANIRIEAEKDDVIAIGAVTSSCGEIEPGPNALEFHTHGTFNGAEATFRVCVEDNGQPGNGVDKFYATCLSGCDYSTADRTPNDLLNSGNVKLHQAASSTNASSDSMDSTSSDGGGQTAVLALDPLLMGDATAGALLPLTVTAVDADGNFLSGAEVTLVQTLADGSETTITAVTNPAGLATFDVTVPTGEVTYVAHAGDLTSNAISFMGIINP